MYNGSWSKQGISDNEFRWMSITRSCCDILTTYLFLPYFIKYSGHFLHWNDAEIFPVHYTWKVAEKGFKMVLMINKLAMINSCEIILEKWK
jgi:hypothetical protein